MIAESLLFRGDTFFFKASFVIPLISKCFENALCEFQRLSTLYDAYKLLHYLIRYTKHFMAFPSKSLAFIIFSLAGVLLLGWKIMIKEGNGAFLCYRNGFTRHWDIIHVFAWNYFVIVSHLCVVFCGRWSAQEKREWNVHNGVLICKRNKPAIFKMCL